MKARRGALALPSLAAGVALALSLPPWGLWPLALVGAGLLYWRLGGLRLRSRLWAGWLAGLGCYVPGLWWTREFNTWGALVLMVVEAGFMAVAAALVPANRARPAAFVAAMTVLEAARLTWPFGGLPLGGVYLGQAGGPLLATARLGGPLMLTGLVYLAGAGLAELVDHARGPGRTADGRGAWWPGGLALGLVVALAGAGALAPDGGAPVGHVLVAAVQGGGRRGLDKAEVPPAQVFDAQLAATYQVARRRPRPALVLWPEDVISLDAPPLAGSPAAATMAGLARQLHTTLAAGVTITVSNSAFDNEVVLWNRSGRIIGTFEKVHRVPFGEYIPFRAFFSHLANLSRVPYDAVVGHASGMLDSPVGRLGFLVSYEVFFAYRGRSSVSAGAELLCVPTNTSSYVAAQVPTQEVAAARVQAVSLGRDLVQAAPTGYSAIVTNTGQVRQRSVLGARQVLVATVALHRGRTLYDRAGDGLVLVPALVVTAWALAVGSLVPWWRRRRSPGPEADEGAA